MLQAAFQLAPGNWQQQSTSGGPTAATLSLVLDGGHMQTIYSPGGSALVLSTLSSHIWLIYCIHECSCVQGCQLFWPIIERSSKVHILGGLPVPSWGSGMSKDLPMWPSCLLVFLFLVKHCLCSGYATRAPLLEGQARQIKGGLIIYS